MGYFPNGTAGDMYEEKYCAKCIHDDDERGCAIMLLHLLYSYDECNNPDSMLHVLIPRDKDGFNKECAMFCPRFERELPALNDAVPPITPRQ